MPPTPGFRIHRFIAVMVRETGQFLIYYCIVGIGFGAKAGCKKRAGVWNGSLPAAAMSMAMVHPKRRTPGRGGRGGGLKTYKKMLYFSLLPAVKIYNRITRAFESRFDRIECPRSLQQLHWHNSVFHSRNPCRTRHTDQRRSSCWGRVRSAGSGNSKRWGVR